jgi:hypothetical protein
MYKGYVIDISARGFTIFTASMLLVTRLTSLEECVHLIDSWKK